MTPPAEGVPKATLLVLITSTTGDNEPGKKWCEDCDAADPVIERVLTASEDRYVLLNALCKRSEYKKALNPNAANYPYRLRPEMNSPTPFAGIPTLVRWEPPYNKIDFPEAETRCYATKAEEAKVVPAAEKLRSRTRTRPRYLTSPRRMTPRSATSQPACWTTPTPT